MSLSSGSGSKSHSFNHEGHEEHEECFVVFPFVPFVLFVVQSVWADTGVAVWGRLRNLAASIAAIAQIPAAAR